MEGPPEQSNKTLPEELKAAFTGKQPFEDNRKFLPLSKLRQFVEYNNVLKHLQACHFQAVNSLSENHLLYNELDKCSAVARYVCGESNDDNGEAESGDVAKKIFAILLTIDKVPAILDFINEGIKDKDLPLGKTNESGLDFNLLMQDGSPTPLFFQKWSYLEKHGFETQQWAMLSPILEPETDGNRRFKRYKFEKEMILPFVAADEIPSHRSFNSKVWKVVIDKEHHKFPQRNHSFALKQLPPTNKAWFDMETDAFERIPFNPHLTPLYATIEHKGHFHLLLPWASGQNLYILWTNGLPMPDRSASLWLWFAEQCLGLAEGLCHIHNTTLTESGIPVDQLPYPANDKTCGRHGDIKPNNILWFRDEAEDNENDGGDEYGKHGKLKICDFGLTRFHHPGTTQVSPREVNATQTYRPPEYDLNEKVSRPFDIWSLGCLYLEFITWLLLGSSAITEFDDLRVLETTNPSIKGDNFFNIWKMPRGNSGTTSTTAIGTGGTSGTNAEETGVAGGAVSKAEKEALVSRIWLKVTRFALTHILRGPHPEVKRSVIMWIKKLRKDSSCSPFLKDLLDYIKKDMLVVNPGKRATCNEVVEKLRAMLQKCRNENESEYLGSFTET